ncbi:hypothetical protein SDD30_02260 [Moorella naiadis]|uniref:hypothetical protein n=1 Tax=Moorella naiadis (nom. illeg.) TaxID=3093670 RepID=UPI003D9C9C61
MPLVDRRELLSLLLQLGNIPSPYGREGEAAAWVYRWFQEQGIKAWKVGATPAGRKNK